MWELEPVSTTTPLLSEWPTRRLLIFSVARILLAIVLVMLFYAVVPDSPNSKLGNWAIIVVGACIFVAVLFWQVREVSQSPRPVVRAVEALGICVSLFLVLFASQYVAESLSSASAFSEPLTKFSALYYTVTVFSTVGFGDITPVSTVARSLTMCQMFGNLIVLGLGVRVLTSVAQERLQEHRLASERPPDPDA